MIYAKDPWYALSLITLVFVAVAAAVLLVTGGSGPSEAGSSVEATTTPRPTEAPATVPAVTALPTGRPDSNSIALDFGRALDLGTIRDALTKYHDANGAFPDTEGELVLLCAVNGEGPGCTLVRFTADVPFNDGLSPYWYTSDGVTYTLVARAAIEQLKNGRCPSQLPDELTGASVMCLNGGAG